MTGTRLLLVMAALAMGLDGAAGADTVRDPAELERTWQAALVLAPDPDGQRERLETAALGEWLAGRAAPPVILYAHGCAGIGEIGQSAARLYAAAGYLFVAPDGFARQDKPESCDPAIPRGGLHRAVLGWRQAEIDYALTRLRALPGLASAALALVGHSEGAITVATIRTGPVSARVVEGWTCNAGWPEYGGLNAPAAEPVMALVGKRDPWFRLPVLRGDCGAFMDANDRSVVFTAPDPLHDRHWLSDTERVQRMILRFLREEM
ncbi:hypothetical protein DDZ14_04690 [Maritimibacter sp. 55A14]|uniref:dienelactone hydrolase family protein n=1 Tax=Maritimibacter sp. 55A14 TaxID=2174844 RepID=UPI000D61840C|nr:hypothetical protein [Maritimibacter sp. 55A14]PWE33497.1 hypothetical protein DDZ14_04690 [Maritimibacter sp. 55A14]